MFLDALDEDYTIEEETKTKEGIRKFEIMKSVVISVHLVKRFLWFGATGRLAPNKLGHRQGHDTVLKHWHRMMI